MNYSNLSCKRFNTMFFLVVDFGYFSNNSDEGFTQSFDFLISDKPNVSHSNCFSRFYDQITSNNSTDKFTVNNNPHTEIQYLIEKDTAWFIISENPTTLGNHKKGGKTFRISIDDPNKIENLISVMKSLKIYWLTHTKIGESSIYQL